MKIKIDYQETRGEYDELELIHVPSEGDLISMDYGDNGEDFFEVTYVEYRYYNARFVGVQIGLKDYSTSDRNQLSV